MPSSPSFISRGRERRSRSRTYRRSRSRSTQRQKRKSRSPGERSKSRGRSEISGRRSWTPRKRNRLPGRRSRSPGRRSRSPGRRSELPRRRYGSPRRRSRSHSPDRGSSRSNEQKPVFRERGQRSRQRSGSPASRQTLGSRNRSRSPIQFPRQHVDSHLHSSSIDRKPTSKQHTISPHRERWKTKKESFSPGREGMDVRDVAYGHYKHDIDVPKHLHLHTEKKPTLDVLHSHNQAFIHSGKPVTVPLPSQTLHERFKTLDQKPLILEENITIGIQRSRSSIPSSTVNISKVFDAAVFTMIHGRDEGKKPIFDREEIKIFRHDEKLSSPEEEEEEEAFERRIIRVEPKRGSADHRSGRHRSGLDGLHDDRLFVSRRSPPVVRRAVDRMDWSDKHLHVTRQRSLSPLGRHGPTVHIRLDSEPDLKYEPGLGRDRRGYRTENTIERIQNNPHDLRHNLMQRGQFDMRTRLDARRGDDSGERDGRRMWDETRMGERDRPITRERRDSAVSDQSSSLKGYSQSGRDLPNFSRRTDKYIYEEWREKPELVPRGPSYFEHDNREDFPDSSFRGRGRFMRGQGRGFDRGRDMERGQYSSSRDSRYTNRAPYRGSGRGVFQPRSRPFRARGSGRPRNSAWKPSDDKGVWKHDMFDKLEKSEDEKPSSTTKDP